jgi:hypothetical protein
MRFSFPPSCLTAFQIAASEAEYVRDLASRRCSVHQQKIALCNALRQRPRQPVPFIQLVLLILYGGLYPDLERRSEVPLEFDHLKMRRNVGPVVMPAHNAVTVGRLVFVRPETAGSVFEFDSDALFAISRVPIGYAVRVSSADFLDSELQTFRNTGEQEHYTQFILRGVLKWGVLER